MVTDWFVYEFRLVAGVALPSCRLSQVYIQYTLYAIRYTGPTSLGHTYASNHCVGERMKPEIGAIKRRPALQYSEGGSQSLLKKSKPEHEDIDDIDRHVHVTSSPRARNKAITSYLVYTSSVASIVRDSLDYLGTQGVELGGNASMDACMVLMRLPCQRRSQL
ncbi:hypothetical protein CIB48_g11047 [Xylaria polymorpha]|nr:hypothetical protein CIB48_g11047 [Xylaria polymorpha]